MAKTSKSKSVINPVDAEITEILDHVEPEILLEEQKEVASSEFEKAIKNLKVDNPPVEEEIEDQKIPEEKVEIKLTKRYLISEIIYMVEHTDNLPPDRKALKYDYAEILVDLETILSVEKIYENRLFDFGIEEEDYDDDFHETACIVHCSAFSDPIIVMDYSFEDLIAVLMEYRNEKC
jgi:hypothetical protein